MEVFHFSILTTRLLCSTPVSASSKATLYLVVAVCLQIAAQLLSFIIVITIFTSRTSLVFERKNPIAPLHYPCMNSARSVVPSKHDLNCVHMVMVKTTETATSMRFCSLQTTLDSHCVSGFVVVVAAQSDLQTCVILKYSVSGHLSEKAVVGKFRDDRLRHWLVLVLD